MSNDPYQVILAACQNAVSAIWTDVKDVLFQETAERKNLIFEVQQGTLSFPLAVIQIPSVDNAFTESRLGERLYMAQVRIWYLDDLLTAEETPTSARSRVSSKCYALGSYVDNNFEELGVWSQTLSEVDSSATNSFNLRFLHAGATAYGACVSWHSGLFFDAT